MEKEKALNTAIAQIERSYGKGAIMKLGEAAAQREVTVIPTGSLPLDLALEKAGPFDYHVCVRRMEEPEDRLVYPIRLEHRLPPIAIPLLPGDRDVTIDLQQLFDQCYDRGPYRVRSPYLDHTPLPQLTPPQAEWATRLLREKGLLPPA